MAVRIRLTRVGATKRPAYRVVAIDRRRARDGRALETLGFYDPLTDPATVNLDAERITAWIGKGAQPSDAVVKLMRQAGMPGVPPAPQTAPTAPKRGPRKAREAAAAETAAPAPAPGKVSPKAAVTEAPEAVTEAPEAVTEAPEAVTEPAPETTSAAEVAESGAEPAVGEEASATSAEAEATSEGSPGEEGPTDEPEATKPPKKT